MKTFVTHAGKEIQMKIKQGTAHIRVEFATGGELPECLSGLFTSEREAEISILKYIDSHKEKKTPKEKE